MDALRDWIESAANSEIRGEDAVGRSRANLQHRAAWNVGNRGGIVAN
jgi:hypothetical protein